MGLAAATHGQIVTWNGGGDGVNWNDPLNWSGAQTPGPTNDVVISVAPNATIVCASGATIQSVQCTGGFFVVSGTLTVTEGASTISGPLTMAPQAGLSGSGVGVIFTATGPTQVDDARLYVSSGALLALPKVGACQSWDSTWWQASGAGSRLVLAGLTNAVCGSGDWHHVWAQNGGRIELEALTTLGDGYLEVLADGLESLVDLTSLTAYNAGGTHYGSMQARNGGTILTPQLALARGWALTLGAAGVLTLPALTNFDGGSLSVASGLTMALPGLTRGRAEPWVWTGPRPYQRRG